MPLFTNQATLSYNGITENSNIVTGEVTQVLRAWKDSTVDSYRAGDILTYVVSMQNSGSMPISNLTLSDDLGAYTFGTGTLVPLSYTGDPVLYYINGILQSSPTVSAGPPLVISGLSIPAGQSALLIYRVRVNNYAPLASGSTIENSVTISGGSLSDVTADETVGVDTDPNLSITKALSPTVVVENGQLVYTFTIQNTGASPATSVANIIVSDTFTPILEDISVTLNGEPWPEAGNYSYNEATGLFTSIAGRITVPAATYTQNPETGVWGITPGVTTLSISGTV